MRAGLFLFLPFFLTITLHAQTPIDTAQTVDIGGIKQFIRIKSKDRSLPLILFLHGGPGNSIMDYAEKFTTDLQNHFTVVQWDQRESGTTRKLNASPRPLTVEQFQLDTYELIRMLLNQFRKPKLYLVGHSWGTFLGFYIAKNYPELLYAYIPICPMINQLESERIILELMTEKAKQTNNVVEIKELSTIKIPFENGAQLFYHRKWVFNYVGAPFKVSKGYVESWSSTWLNIFNEASKENLMESTPKLNCPVYFFVGRKDYQTNSQLTEDYYKILSAPKKGLYWFERSAHSLPSTESELMQKIIIEKILPQTSIH